MDKLIYCIPILFLIILGKREQKQAFFFFLFLYALKVVFTSYVAVGFGREDRFLANNTARLIQNLIMSYVLYKYIYKDHRSIIPVLILSIISVVYFISNITILYNDWIVQNLIYNYRYFLGSLIILSIVDLGRKNYERLYDNDYMRNNKHFNNMFPSFYIQENKVNQYRFRK